MKTGELVVDTTGPEGGFISGFYLESEQLHPSEYDFGNEVAVHLQTNSLFAVGLLPPAKYSVGNAMPPGLELDDLAFTHASFIPLAGITSLELEVFNDRATAFRISSIPEPSSGPTLFFGGFMALMVRTRER